MGSAGGRQSTTQIHVNPPSALVEYGDSISQREQASIHNLRIAAGVGRVDVIDGFFHPDGSLKAEAGPLAWPFGDPVEGWSRDSQDIIDNAFVYACTSGRIEAAERLLRHGARINALPPGFDYAGTGLH